MTFDGARQGESYSDIAVGLRSGEVVIVQLQGNGGVDCQVVVGFRFIWLWGRTLRSPYDCTFAERGYLHLIPSMTSDFASIHSLTPAPSRSEITAR